MSETAVLFGLTKTASAAPVGIKLPLPLSCSWEVKDAPKVVERQGEARAAPDGTSRYCHSPGAGR